MSESDNKREVLEVPVPAPVAIRQQEPKLVQVTKFLSWLTACILAVSVLVSLYGVTTERNDLRNQVSALTLQLNCRAVNNFVVTRASADKQIALANHSVLLGDFDALYIDVQTGVLPLEVGLAQATELRQEIEESKVVLTEAAKNLEEAVEQVDRALESCQTE